MKFKRLACLMIAGICLFSFSLPSGSFATVKSHWAISTLENLQSKDLLLGISKDSKKLNSSITLAEFDSMLNEIWTSEFTVKATTDIASTSNSKSYLTRKTAAEKIFNLFNKSTNSEADAITWIKSAKIMSGYPSGDFKPADKVTLAQGVAIMSHIKDYLKNHPEVKLDFSDTQAALHPKDNQLTYTAAANTKGTIDFTLSWGEKKTGGYSVKITKVAQSGKELRISYKLTSPAPDAIVTQALTYPKDTVNLEMGMEAYKQLTLILVEDKGTLNQE